MSSNTIKTLRVDTLVPGRKTGLFADPDDNSLGALCNELYLECEDGPVDMDPADPRVLRLVIRRFACRYSLHAESYCGKAAIYELHPSKTVGPMFDGRFIWSSDSRFPSDYPIPLHDRYESPEEYEALSH